MQGWEDVLREVLSSGCRVRFLGTAGWARQLQELLLAAQQYSFGLDGTLAPRRETFPRLHSCSSSQIVRMLADLPPRAPWPEEREERLARVCRYAKLFWPVQELHLNDRNEITHVMIEDEDYLRLATPHPYTIPQA